MSQQHFVLGICGARPRVLAYECMRPPVPLLSTSSEALLDGLWHVDSVKAYSDCNDKLAMASDIHAIHIDRDGASSNDKLLSLLVHTQSDGILVSDYVCGNHKTNLCKSTTLNAMDSTLIPALFSTCLFVSAWAGTS